MIRTLQPGIIVNRRWGGGMPDFPVSGDYDNPEQEFGTFEVERPWEMCCTISEAWSWTGGQNTKSYYTNQRILIQAIISGGNLALNTGPSPLGAINPPERDIYQQIGDWLAQYGESVYQTKAGPYKPGPWGGSTCNGNTVYLHFLTDFADETNKQIVLPALPAKIKEVRMLTGGSVKVKEQNGNWVFFLEGDINPLDNIVKLDLDNSVEGLMAVETDKKEAEIVNITGRASTAPSKAKSPGAIFGSGHEVFAEGKRHKIWWSPEKGDKQPWILAEFEREEEIAHIMLAEQIRNCSVKNFKLEYLSGEQWMQIFQGNEIGMDFSLKTDGIKTKSIRLTILNSDRTPAIGVFRVFRK